MFSLILAQGAENLARICRLVFALLTVFLLLLALAHFTGSVTLHHTAAVVGFACSLPGLICGVRQGGREVLNLFNPAEPRPTGPLIHFVDLWQLDRKQLVSLGYRKGKNP